MPDINPLHRLAWIGNRGIGALTYQPALTDGDEHQSLQNISSIAEFAAKTDVENFLDIPKSAIRAGGSALGARPKFWAHLIPIPNTNVNNDRLVILMEYRFSSGSLLTFVLGIGISSDKQQVVLGDTNVKPNGFQSCLIKFAPTGSHTKIKLFKN